MARPHQGNPNSFPFGDWASRPLICGSNLVPDDGKRRRNAKSAQNFGRDLLKRFSTDGIRSAWKKANHLPSDLKWIAMVVPLILGIWVLARPSTAEPVDLAKTAGRQEQIPAIAEEAPAPEVKSNQAAIRPVSTPPVEVEQPAVAAKPAAPTPPTAPSAPTAWDAFTARVAQRASIDLTEDFHNGLSSWQGRGEWARSWTYDRSGTVRPGHLSIFQPTVRLSDYVFEMKASIERRAIQWVVRAVNTQNYHFARLNVTPGAPLTKLEFERWTVINGRAGRVTRLPLPHGSANQTLYSIRVEVHGDSVTTYLQDQVIDTFSDPRLQEGGVGLVGSQDDRPRIYGIHVTHQNDFLGKLCSFLAPPPINTQGSD